MDPTLSKQWEAEPTPHHMFMESNVSRVTSQYRCFILESVWMLFNKTVEEETTFGVRYLNLEKEAYIETKIIDGGREQSLERYGGSRNWSKLYEGDPEPVREEQVVNKQQKIMQLVKLKYGSEREM